MAQILQASIDVAAVQKFTGWLPSHRSLKGTALQDAAQKAGFAACYIALAPFPQVIKMMAEKPDWTQQLGKAFTTDKAAVYESIQRLRATGAGDRQPEDHASSRKSSWRPRPPGSR